MAEAVRLPRLIVNGDDLGRTESLTRGVLEAHERGILRSASLVAGSPCFDLAVRLLEDRPELAVGVHLYVDEYPPISPAADVPSLVGSDGRFPPRARSLFRILAGRVRREELRREWRAQIRRVQEAGIRVSHVDGHGHCHAAPTVAGLVADLCDELGVPAVRLPAEPLRYLGVAPFSPARHAQKLLLAGACARARGLWSELRVPDAFFGFLDGGRLSVESLESLADALPSGVSELMAHPGLSNDDAPFGLAYDWRGDLDALLAFSKEEFEERFAVELVSWREAWDA